MLFYAHLSAQVPQSLSGLNAGFEAPLSSVAFIACLIPELQLLNHGHKSVKSNHSAHQCRLFTALNQAGGHEPSLSAALKHFGQSALRSLAEALVHADSRFIHCPDNNIKGNALRISQEAGQITGPTTTHL